MKYTKVAGEKSTVKFEVSFTEAEYQEALNQAFLKTRGRYSVPGFRKGKATRHMIQNFYGEDVFFDEALRILYSKHYPEILDKESESVTPVASPSLDLPKNPDGNGLTIELTVPVKPEVKIDTYKGLKFKKYEYNVSDAEVDNEIKNIFKKNAATREVTDRPCQLSDTVNINFKGTIDGVEFPGGTAEDFNLELGSNSFIAGFEDGVVGMNIGETKNINVKFPDDYNAEELKGKDAVFEIKLNSFTEKVYPEVTDELVKEKFRMDSVADFRDRVRKMLESEAKRNETEQTENGIIDELCKHATAEIPDAMLDEEIDEQVEAFEKQLKTQKVTLSDYLSYMKLSNTQFRAQFKAKGEHRILSRLVLEKIIKDENIKVEQSDIDEALEKEAKTVEKTLEEYKKNIKPENLNYIANNLLYVKLFDFLKANNTLEA